jgi:glutathione S-transferase
MENPRYWISQWYSTRFAQEPWPGGWYWHDLDFNWHGPFDSEHEAAIELKNYEASERAASDARERARPQFELYYHPTSAYCQKVLIAIYEKGARFTPHIVDLANSESREDYRKLYPLGKIPLIVLNHGPLIPESNIIIEYLETLGGPRLISQNLDVARKIRFKDKFIDLREGRKPKAEQDADQLETSRRHITLVYEFLEHELEGQKWANGEEFSMSDCSAAAALLYAPEVMPYIEYPNIVSYAERLSERGSVRRARQDAAQHREETGKATSGGA